MEPELKTVLDSVRGSVESVVMQVKQQQVQLDAQDMRFATKLGNYAPPPSLIDKLKENEQVERIVHDKKGTAVLTLEGDDVARLLQRKSAILSTGAGWQPTSGVLSIDRIPGITSEPRQQLWVESLLPTYPTTQQIVDFVKVQTPLSPASPQVEGSLKMEESLTFGSASERVRTIAAVIPASKQCLDDLEELNSFLSNGLSFYTNLAVEQQLLSGDGLGENLHGMITQSSPFNQSLLGGAFQRIDVLARAAQQLAASKELTPDWVVFHPNDLWALRTTKDGYGRYLLGDPSQAGDVPSLWGMKLVATTSIESGTFLMGSSSPIASEIRDRMSLVVEISTSHADFFARNLVMFRCERRLALLVKRGSAFISGSFSSSPA